MTRQPPSTLTEDKIVQLLKNRFASSTAALRVGIGDDGAVLRPAGAREDWVLTTDLLVEEVDFRRSWMSPAQLGHKALAANLSDLAAMGARPCFYFVSLGLPRDCRAPWIESFYRGMTALGKRWGAVLAGGDLSRSATGILVSLTAVGETEGRRVLLRSSARPGDVLFVTGVLGKAAAGLRLLRGGKTRARTAAERAALDAQRTPEPRCSIGRWLAGSGLVNAMMDLSDGLSSDLPRLCAASRVGALIDGDSLPAFPESRAWDCEPTALALHGGEDFELLFAVPIRHVKRLRRTYPWNDCPITAVGVVSRRRGVRWRPALGAAPEPLHAGGWDHFGTV